MTKVANLAKLPEASGPGLPDPGGLASIHGSLASSGLFSPSSRQSAQYGNLGVGVRDSHEPCETECWLLPEKAVMNEASDIPAGVDTGRPTPARIYDYMLQGHNYFQVDRLAAEQILKAAPEIRDAAFSNRGFHQRAAKWIAQRGVRQF